MSKEQSAVLLVLSLNIGLALTADICEYQMNGVYLSHPADCNKFVECQNGETYRISSCPLGLHFNRFKGVCDLRQRAACDIEFVNFMQEETNCSACCAIYGCYVNPECPATPGTSTTVISPTNPLTTETYTTGASTSSPEAISTPATPATTPASTSPTEPFSSTFTPTSPETTSVPVTSSTSSNPDLPNTPGTSGSSTTAETINSTFTPARPETTTVPVPGSSPSTPDIISSTLTPDIPQNNQCPNNMTVCQKEPDNSAMYVNGTCNQYIVCVAGCAYKMSCPANLQYNITKQKCDYPQNVDCPWPSTPAITGPSGITCAHQGQCEKQPDGKLLANPNSDGYIICQCECEVERPCPEGTKFDTKLLTCAWKANKIESGNENENKKKYEKDGNFTSTVCGNAIELCKNRAEGTLLPVEGICNKFYKCNFGCAVEILCPNNLIFNPFAEYCDYPTNYKCPWPFTAPTGAIAGPSGIACGSGGRCAGRLDGALFPSLTSCTKYVICQCECELERNCPKNLYWDKNLFTCNYSENVNCELDL